MITCVPHGFNARVSERFCEWGIKSFNPSLVSTCLFIISISLLGSMTVRNLLKFWQAGKDVEAPWLPWAGLSTAALLVVQAVVSADLVRSGGYLASGRDLALFWFMAPRMQWFSMLFYAIAGDQYKRSAMDAILTDGIMNWITLSAAAYFASNILGNEDCNNFDRFFDLNTDGDVDYLKLYRIGVILYLSFCVVNAIITIVFFWLSKGRLNRLWSGLIGVYCMAVFGMAWLFLAGE